MTKRELKPGAVCFADEINPSLAVVHPELGGLLLSQASDGIKCIENACPHVPRIKLSATDIEDVHGRLCAVCPRHRRRFKGGLCIEMETGVCWSYDGKRADLPRATTFACSVEWGQVFVHRHAESEASTRTTAAVSSPIKRKTSSADMWSAGIIKRKRWLTQTLVEVRIEVPIEIPTSGYWHYYIECQGVEREYTPAPGCKTGLAVLWIRMVPGGEFSAIIKASRVGQEVRMQLEETLPDKSITPVAVIGGGTGALEAFHDLDLPMLGSFRSDKEYDIFENHGFRTARVTCPLPALPEPQECCGQGCDPCVLDVYAEQCEAHDRYKTRLRGRIQAEDLKILPDGPIIVCGTVGFRQHIAELMNGSQKTPILLDG